jgi:post-segregation antitoxin (ccd killing protein)
MMKALNTIKTLKIEISNYTQEGLAHQAKRRRRRRESI